MKHSGPYLSIRPFKRTPQTQNKLGQPRQTCYTYVQLIDFPHNMPMLASERRKIILEELETSGRVHAGDLSENFNVSRMTIHRDLSRLAKKGFLEKVFGGAVSVGSKPVRRDTCAMCEREVQERTAFVVQCEDDLQLKACCPHCGIMLLSTRSQVVSALATDFLHAHMINVRSATFLVNPDLTVCCTPTVLCFQRRDEAEKFQSGFGGEVMDLQQTQAHLRESMALGHE